MAEAQRIIVIDDHPGMRQFLEETLTAAGYKVDSVNNAGAGIVLARERDPVLVILDMNMPDITGWQAVRRMRAEEALKDMPVIGISAHDTAADHDEAHAAGCDSYLTKPLTPARLLSAIAERLS